MSKISEYWDNVHLKYDYVCDGWLKNYLHLFKNDDLIVELGCGRAESSDYLFKNGFKNITASDFSKEALRFVNQDTPYLKTMYLDISKGLPFNDDSINVIIADLSLHYFDMSTTKYILNEIYRVLKNNGYLVARVNSVNDKFHKLNNAQEIEENFFYDGTLYKRFFKKEDLESLLKGFKVCDIEEKKMNRYKKPKVLWEVCVKKIKSPS